MNTPDFDDNSHGEFDNFATRPRPIRTNHCRNPLSSWKIFAFSNAKAENKMRRRKNTRKSSSNRESLPFRLFLRHRVKIKLVEGKRKKHIHKYCCFQRWTIMIVQDFPLPPPINVPKHDYKHTGEGQNKKNTMEYS